MGSRAHTEQGVFATASVTERSKMDLQQSATLEKLTGSSAKNVFLAILLAPTDGRFAFVSKPLDFR